MRELVAEGISTAGVFDSPGGGPVVRQRRAGVPGERVCMLFEWVAGVPLSRRMSAPAARQMGVLAATLHAAAPTTEAPREPPLIADRVLCWRTENRLAEVAAGTGSLLDEALARAQEMLDAIWRSPPHPPRLLHGDLTPDNVLVNGGGGLVPIDFQDMVWGFDIQDVAITSASFARFPEAAEIREQLRAGYAEVRPWPDLDEPTGAALVAGRRLQQINLALTLRRPGFPRLVELGCQRIADWMHDRPNGGGPG
jgi:Ser/Thr protein kinase RdoA (MazF antagonist)